MGLLVRELTLIVMLAAIAGILGCSRDVPASRAASPSIQPPAAVTQLRIVSLSPAISRTLIDFGLEDHVVGRTPHCAALDPAIPVAGDLLNLNYELLVRLNPTHVLVQPPAEGIDPQLVELAASHGWTIGQWRLNDIHDVETMVQELPGVLYNSDDARLAEATSRAAELVNRIAAALSPGNEPIFHGRTMIVGGVDPVMVFGRGTYLHDVLAALGGTNAVSAAGWATLSLEDVTRLDPQAIVIVIPSGTIDEDVRTLAGPLMDLNIAAVREDRIAVLRNPDAYMPCSGVIAVAEELRGLLRSFHERPR